MQDATLSTAQFLLTLLFKLAAMAVLALPQEVAELVAHDGQKALERLPGVGKSLASTIASYVASSREAGPASSTFQLSS